MANNRRELFRRLTRLFRTGPIVKSKIKTASSYVDGPASSFLDHFKNSTNLYANAIASYGTYDRLCIDLDTKIAIPDENGFKTLRDLIGEFGDSNEKFIVYAYDHDKKQIVPAYAHHPRSSGVRKTIKLIFDDNTDLVCTYDHKCMMRDGSYKEAKDLNEGDSMMPFYRKQFAGKAKKDGYKFNGYRSKHVREELKTTNKTLLRHIRNDGFENWKDFQERVQDKNHKIIKIEEWHEIEVGDLTVDGFANFATDSILVHNSRYADYAEMEYTPELATGLNIYADETCASDERGRIIHIFSDNQRIRELLEHLFYDTLNVEFNLRSWVRNLVKYGDFFLLNDVHTDAGIVNVLPIPVNEVEREEGYDPDQPFAVRFRWVTQGNAVLQDWEVTHFRLRGNDNFLPYGASVIESARRIWRQLILIEDAMLVYRIIRSPERRVFYIDVANVAHVDVPTYLENARTALKRQSVVNETTGRVDLRYNPLPVHKDTPVPLLDGTTMTIENIARRMVEEPGWTPWVYSVQDKTHQIVPGKVTWCGKNYHAKKLTKVWLDDGSYIITAPEHPFVMRDGSARRADQIIPGDSIMSAYRDLNNRGYERIIEPSGERVSTHVMVARDVYTEKWINTDRPIVHHKHPELGEKNKRNNTPDNIEVMNFWEHRKMHAEHCELTLNTPERLAARVIQMAEYNKTEEHRIRTIEVNKRDRKAERMGQAYNGTDLHKSHNDNRRRGQRQSWDADKQGRSEALRWIIPNEIVRFAFETIKINPKIGREELTNAIRQSGDLCSLLEQANVQNKRSSKQFHVNAIISKLVRAQSIPDSNYRTFRKFAIENTAPVNHQVVSVETLENVSDDVYCMTVVGSNNEDDRHNFAVNGLGTQIVNNQLQSLVFVWNSVDEDYFIPVRGDNSTKIETLAGGQFTGDIEDVEYIQKKLFAAIGIPRAYLGYDEDLSGKATLAQEDIRFSRAITHIQKVVTTELNKIAIIHLAAHGFTDPNDLTNFKIGLSNPSTAAQQQKLELWRSRFEIASTIPEGYLSKRWVYKNLFLLDDNEIEAVKEDLQTERKEELKLEQLSVESEAEPGAEMGGMEAGGAPGSEEELSAVMGGAEPEKLEAGVDIEWDIIAPSFKTPESLEEIEAQINEFDVDRPKGRVRRGRPHKQLAWGVDSTEMPDMNAHVDYSENDINDMDFMRTLGKPGAGLDKIDEYLNDKISAVAGIDARLAATIGRMNKALGISSSSYLQRQILIEEPKIDSLLTALEESGVEIE